MFLLSVESFNLVSNVWHVVIRNVPNCVDNYICFEIFVVFLYLSWRPQAQILRIILYSNLFLVDSCDLLPSSQYILPNSKLFSLAVFGKYVFSPVQSAVESQVFNVFGLRDFQTVQGYWWTRLSAGRTIKWTQGIALKYRDYRMDN